MADIGIRMSPPAVLTAPALVWFEATGLDGFDVDERPDLPHDPSFTRITYVWTVEGGALPAYDAPNLPTAWNRPGRAYGKHVAFVFPEENTLYRIRLWAIDESGHVGETEAELRTVDSASAFQATLCLDPSGRFDRMPPGATALTDVAELQDAAIGARGETRVLLARGQTIEDFRLEARMVNFVGAFGDPDLPRPILRARSDKGSMFRFRRLVHPQVTLDGLDCRGEWDASTETGRRTDNPLDFTSSAMAHFTVWDCRFSGFHSIRAAGDPGSPWTGGMGNTEVTNWSSYGIYVPRSDAGRLALVGCDIAQHPEALNHYKGNRHALMNTQGPLRVPIVSHFYSGASSYLSRGGWAGAIDQDCLRLNSRCVPGCGYVVERCTLESGGSIFKMSGSSGKNPEMPGNYLFDKVLALAGGGKTGLFGQPHFGGTTLRNMVMAQLDVASAHGFAYRESLSLVPHIEDAGNLATPVAIYNCSVMNLRSAENDVKGGDHPEITNKTTFLDYTEENNIVHAPRLKAFAEDRHAPIRTDRTLPGFMPRYRGSRPNFDFETGKLEDAVPNGSVLHVAYPEGTDQAYWQSLPPSDGKHGLRIERHGLRAAAGDFEVSFDRYTVTILNTSGIQWDSGWQYFLRLDRSSKLPPMNRAHGNPTDRELPLPLPDTGSPARLSGPPMGRHAYDDFLGNVRPGPSETGLDHEGKPRPEEGGTKGAVHV